MRIDRLKIFLDSMGGGAWPFLVGGVICLVNSDNERDSSLLNSHLILMNDSYDFLEGQAGLNRMKKSKNRSVMPLDVRGRKRATLAVSTSNFQCRKAEGTLLITVVTGIVVCNYPT